MTSFDPQTIRYIKLGSQDAWSEALEVGELRMGHKQIPHAICQAGDWDGIAALFVAEGRRASKAHDFTRELRDFYTLGPDCLWITFARGHLWWAFVEPQVEPLPDGGRRRRVIGKWSNLDLLGQPLRRDQMSSQITRVAAYRQTICQVADPKALLARIRGVQGATLMRALQVQTELLDVTEQLIAGLHEDDFEFLVDLIFARSGWQRASVLGGTLKDIDLDVYEPLTGMRGLVQVKSQASQSVLDDYLGRLTLTDAEAQIFFICHSPKGRLVAPEQPNIHIWTGSKLAETTLKAGLFDWLLLRAA